MTVPTNSHREPPAPQLLRVATYNIHKGVQGLGPTRRLEIHNLGLAVEQMDADIVCLQEVRKMNRREAEYFRRWPDVPQADFLALRATVRCTKPMLLPATASMAMRC